ncbi:uncharacterized protein LOC135208850 isoform X2 [Macrobrachium nipponense]|uniref:uncharacterized protein LOC135208850 isoform X2 n=1 Tax=Macrobrachium nipponense TaxID=159736 RepID=UPI0030C86991
MAEDPSDDSCEFTTLFRDLLKHEWGIDALSVLGESDPQSVAEPLHEEEEAQYPTGYVGTSSEFEEIENRVLFGAREDTGESDEDDEELLVSKPFSEVCNIDLIRPPPMSTTKEAVQGFIETCEKEGSRDQEDDHYALTMIEPEKVSQYDSYDDLESFDFTEGLSSVPLLEEVEQVSRSRMRGGKGTGVAHCVQEGSQSHFTSVGDITSELQNLSLRINEDFCHEQRTTGVSSLQSSTSETQQTNEAVVLVPCPPSPKPETQRTNEAVGLVPYYPPQDQEINQTGAHSFSSYTQQRNQTLTLVSYHSSQTQETDQTVTLVPYPSPQTQQISRTVDLVPYPSSSETQQTNETVTLVPYLSPSKDQQTNETVTLVSHHSLQPQQTNRTVDLVSYPSSSQNQETSQTVTLVSYLSPSKHQQSNETVTLVSHHSLETQETDQTVTLVPYPSPQTQQISRTVDLVPYPSSSQTQQASRTVEIVPYPSLQTLQTNQMITLVPCPSSQTQQTNDTVNLVAYLSSQTQERNETVTLVPYLSPTQTQQTNQTVGHVSYHSSQTHKRNQTLTLVPYLSSSQTQQPNQTATLESYRSRSRTTRNSSRGRSANETPEALPGTSSLPENDVIVPGNSVPGRTSRATQVDIPGSLPALHNTQNDTQSNCDSPAPPAEDVQAAQAAQAEYTCQICQWKTADVQSMKDHYEMHKNLIKLRCKLCGKLYIRAETLRRHLINGHKLAEGPELNEHQSYFVCKDCGEKFNKRGQYTSHLQAHISDYPMKCDKCTCSYPLLSHLITHKVHAHHKSYVGNLESLQMYISSSL